MFQNRAAFCEIGNIVRANRKSADNACIFPVLKNYRVPERAPLPADHTPDKKDFSNKN
jgi:hypothetical protein